MENRKHRRNRIKWKALKKSIQAASRRDKISANCKLKQNFICLDGDKTSNHRCEILQILTVWYKIWLKDNGCEKLYRRWK